MENGFLTLNFNNSIFKILAYHPLSLAKKI